MKIILEIHEKTIEAAKAVMVSQCENEKQENEIVQLCDKVKNAEEPIDLNFEKIRKEFKEELYQLEVAVLMLTLNSVELNEMEDDFDDVDPQHLVHQHESPTLPVEQKNEG